MAEWISALKPEELEILGKCNHNIKEQKAMRERLRKRGWNRVNKARREAALAAQNP